MDKIKYFEENIHKKTLNICDKLYIFIVMTLWNRNYIYSLIYGLIISILCSILQRGEIILPFLLLSIVDLNVTLKNVILSIKLRHKEFTRAMFLAFIFMYSMSNLAFFFFNSDYIEELDYYDDNYCKSLKFCVFNAIDNGLRARGGIGDSGKRISFMKNKNHYIERLILDDIFFLLVVIILIDLVFGIIIGEFDALRGEEQKHETDRLYHCFICHVNKNTLEKNRQNFYVHVNKIHNMWNYVSYMILVKLSNLHDLNSINSYVRNKIENKDIS
jgi:inositol 1,4,5-triphosphate receptor type 3